MTTQKEQNLKRLLFKQLFGKQLILAQLNELNANDAWMDIKEVLLRHLLPDSEQKLK